MFNNFDFTDFWDDDEYVQEKYIENPPNDELINEIETSLGYKLPQSYIYLMKKHNGGIPKKRAFPTKEETSYAKDHIAITGIMGIGRNKIYSLCGDMGSQFWINEWQYPEVGIAICTTPSGGHDMIFLDYTECGREGEPKVVYIDVENNGKIIKIADNFESFIIGLVDENIFPE